MNTTRRAILIAPAAALAASLRGTPVIAARATMIGGEAPWLNFPHQPFDLVREVVGAAHRDEEKVRDLVGRHPAVVNAWDWGFGDWESPLGAAVHTGRRSIALFLIEKGARIDLFAAAMLGQLDVVKRLVKANPNVARSVGPHGISLLAHATVGGDEAKAVADCLATVEGSGNGLSVKPLTAAEKARYAGTYELAGGGGTFEITLDKERLSFVSGMSTMRIHFLGDHEFFSAGVPSVRFRFDAAGEMAAVVTITDHDTVITGKRSA